MSANSASSRVTASTPRCALIERRLRRYAPAVQARVRAVAARHTRLADLAVSFPSLLFALALPRPDIDPGPAIARVIDGRPLREVAAAARLPVDGLTPRCRPCRPTSYSAAGSSIIFRARPS